MTAFHNVLRISLVEGEYVWILVTRRNTTAIPVANSPRRFACDDCHDFQLEVSRYP